MPAIQDIQWHNVNSQRNYPFRDEATRLDSNGRILPNDLLVDFNLWGEFDKEDRVYIGSVCLSAGLFSLTVLREDEAGDELLATLALTLPITPSRNYQLTSLVDNVVGWVALGTGVRAEGRLGHWLFTGPAQTGIIERLVRLYTFDRVSALSRDNSTIALDGIVHFTTSTPDLLSIRAITQEDSNPIIIENDVIEAVKFGLNESTSGITIHRDFIGPCEGSPESNTCNRPAIFTVNGVDPDCNGVLYIEVEEEVSDELGELLSITLADGTIELDFDIGLVEVCERSKLPLIVPQFVDPDCYSPCESINGGPFEDYEPQYGSD